MPDKDIQLVETKFGDDTAFWSYLAGFTDGEGTILMLNGTGYMEPQFRLSQSGEGGHCLLEGIKNRLLVYGVVSSVWKLKNYKNRLTKLPAWALTVHRRKNVLPLLRRLLPFLKLKRNTAQDVLRFCSMYTSLRKGKVGSFLARERSIKHGIVRNFKRATNG